MKDFTFEEMWEYQLGSLMLKEECDSLLWKKTVARVFWDQQQKKLDTVNKENKMLIDSLLWLADSPSDEVIHSMKKKTIIDLFKLNEEKAKMILSHIKEKRAV